MKIIYFHDDIESFLDSLEKRTRQKTVDSIRLLSIEEYHLSMPFSKKIDRDLYELRIIGMQSVRIFYTFHNNAIVLLHAIIKKTQRLERHDLETALRRLSTLQA